MPLVLPPPTLATSAGAALLLRAAVCGACARPLGGGGRAGRGLGLPRAGHSPSSTASPPSYGTDICRCEVTGVFFGSGRSFAMDPCPLCFGPGGPGPAFSGVHGMSVSYRHGFGPAAWVAASLPAPLAHRCSDYSVLGSSELRSLPIPGLPTAPVVSPTHPCWLSTLLPPRPPSSFMHVGSKARVFRAAEAAPPLPPMRW